MTFVDVLEENVLGVVLKVEEKEHLKEGRYFKHINCISCPLRRTQDYHLAFKKW